MTDPEVPADTPARDAVAATTPHPARMYDYFLGGKDNFEADRIAAEQAMSLVPHSRDVAWANRQFLSRAVAAMARAGIDQFIDLGSGFPTSPNVHEVAREIQPGTRVVYVDFDPVVISHNQALFTKAPGIAAIGADLRDPAAVLSHPLLRDLIDFGRPVGVLFVAVLHFVTDDHAPGEIVAAFRQRMAPGSMLALSHITSDGTPQAVQRAIQAAYAAATVPAVFRPQSAIEAFFGDFPLLEPGLVAVADWRPELHTTQVKSTLRFIGAVGQAT